jgi:hypothetical protein
MILSLKMNFSIHTKMIENYLDLAGDMWVLQIRIRLKGCWDYECYRVTKRDQAVSNLILVLCDDSGDIESKPIEVQLMKSLKSYQAKQDIRFYDRNMSSWDTFYYLTNGDPGE